MTKRLAVVKVKTFFSLLSEIKAKALIDTLANRLTDVEIETLGETVSQIYAEVLCKKLLTGKERWVLKQLMRQWER